MKQERTTGPSRTFAPPGRARLSIDVEPGHSADPLESALARRTEAELDVRAQAEANRLKSLFLARVAHELRTPVWAMTSAADLLLRGDAGPLTPEQTALVEGLVSKGRHLRLLLTNVLDLSRAQAGFLPDYPRPVDLVEVVGLAVEGMRPLATCSGLTLTSRLIEVPGVSIDPTHVRQVLYNFLSNAIKFTPPGGRVNVTLRPEAPDAFRLGVEDNGPGIATADIPRLFVEFQQLPSASSGPEHGVGLGLALVRQIVEAQGGRVGMHPTEGGGASFFAVLPTRPRVRGFPARLRRPLPDARVLVVDDDPTMNLVLRRRLEHHGHRVVGVTTGEAALAAARQQSFAAAVVDLILPDMSGLDLVRSLRLGPHNSTLGVVLITGATDVGPEVGPDVQEVIHKPFRLDQVDAALARLGLVLRSTEEIGP